MSDTVHIMDLVLKFIIFVCDKYTSESKTKLCIRFCLIVGTSECFGQTLLGTIPCDVEAND